jgi:hypothetical protein
MNTIYNLEEGLYPNIRRIRDLFVRSLMIQITGTYNQLFLRPYTANADGSIINELTNRIHNTSAINVAKPLLAGIASNLIVPMTSPQAPVSVPNGWDIPRARFILIVDCQWTVGSASTLYIQGYTDYYGVSHSQAIDPKMRFYINSITTTVSSTMNTPFGMQTYDNIHASSQLLWDPNWAFSPNDPNRKISMRPMDVISGIQTQYLTPGLDYYTINSFVDNRSFVLADPISSKRRNNLPVDYLASLINAYNHTKQNMNFTDNESNLYDSVKQQLQEDTAGEDPFIRKISRVNGVSLTNEFTFDQLEKIDPNTRHNTKVITLGPAQISQVHQTGLTENWNGTDRQTIVATILAQSVPAIMMELLISKISFRTTNHDIGMQVTTIIEGVKTLNNTDMVQNYEMFKARLENELLRDITFNNQEPFMLHMKVDLFGETWISLSLGSEPAIDFVAPSFCDNLYSPIVTMDPNHFAAISADFESIMRHCGEAVSLPPVNAYPATAY